MGIAIKHRKVYVARPSSRRSPLTRHNTPELMRRRVASIAAANAGRTKKSDNALTEILLNFQKLTF
jgi:hypothetical protein